MLEKKHEMIRKLAREFAEKEIAPYAVEADKTGEYPQELIDKLAKYKFTGITLPKEYGGAGGDYRSLAIVMEEFARVDASITSYIMANSLSGAPYLYYGTEEQKQKYLKPMALGQKIGAFGLTEPGAGSDASAIATTAVIDGDDYIINGRKCFITMGAVCDYIVAFCKTNLDIKGTKGISAIIVESDREGFSTGKIEDKMGIRASKTSDVVFDNVRVPRTNLLGKEGEGFKLAMSILDAGRITVASQALGLAQGALDEAIKYTKERIQFGKPISKLQNTQFQIADMDTKVETARALIYQTAEKYDKKVGNITKEAAMCKLYAGEIANQVAYQSLQLHGGYGFMKEYAIERIYRDARIMTIYEGTSEVQKVVISNILLK